MNELANIPPQSKKAVWSGLFFLLVIVSLLLFMGYELRQWMKDGQKLPVERIEIKGELERLEMSMLVDLIKQQHPESFFSLNVQSVYQTVTQHPWVYQASVRKRWPKRLIVHVVEQVPVAFWNQHRLLNTFGEEFDATTEKDALPYLYGPETSHSTVLRGYRAMQAIAKPLDMKVTELRLSERYAWTLVLDNAIRVNLGRGEFVDRLQRFIDLFPLIDEDPRVLNYVDLRYDTGLAIGWLETEQPES